jgi:hypothetical protein
MPGWFSSRAFFIAGHNPIKARGFAGPFVSLRLCVKPFLIHRNILAHGKKSPRYLCSEGFVKPTAE